MIILTNTIYRYIFRQTKSPFGRTGARKGLMVSSTQRKNPTTWNPEYPVSLRSLDALLDAASIGVSDTSLDREARNATHRYCADTIVEAASTGVCFRASYIEAVARAFYEGYKACCSQQQLG